jgi:hypothetical protein
MQGTPDVLPIHSAALQRGAIGPAPITVSTVKHRLIRFRLSGARLRYVYHLAGNTERY